MLKSYVTDCRHAIRIYRRTPVSSLIAVLVLAIGMSFVSAFISLYVDTALRPHSGFESGSRIVTLGWSDGRRSARLRADLIERIASETSSLEAVAGISTRFGDVGGTAHLAEWVTQEFFPGIRPRIHIGRGLERADHAPGAEPVAVISYSYWQEQLGGRPAVIDTMLDVTYQDLRLENGRPVPVNVTVPFRIVGIMMREMAGVTSAPQVALWLPAERVTTLFFGEANSPASMYTIARRNRTSTANAIERELNNRYLSLREEFGAPAGYQLDAIDGLVQDIAVQRDARLQLKLFLAGSLLLALVAACNVSLFLLARAPGRRRELGIRMAVGASLGRLTRQLASESTLLVAVSGALGFVLSLWLSRILSGLDFLRQAEWHNVTALDWRVLVIIGAFLALLTLIVSLAPILDLRRTGIAASSRHVAGRAPAAQHVACSVQIAIAGALGGLAIAFTWYVGSLMFADPGYQTHDLYRVPFRPLSANDFEGGISLELIAVEAERRRELIEAVPGVTAVAFGSPVPGEDALQHAVSDPADPANQIQVRRVIIDRRFIDLLRLKLLHGMTPAEDQAAVALVNQTLARAFFGREDVVGQSLPFEAQGSQRPTIIGVLEDLSFGHPSATIDPIYFVTLTNVSFLTLPQALIESSLTAGDLQQSLQRLIDAGDLESAIEGNVRSLAERRRELIAPDRARGLLTISVSVLAVCLAAFGLHGTQRYLVAAGRREYAIRAALGASPRSLGLLVLGRGLVFGLPGLVIGTLLAFVLVAWLRADWLAREISPGSVTVVVVIGLTALLLTASLGPARQAKRTQPALLLREE